MKANQVCKVKMAIKFLVLPKLFRQHLCLGREILLRNELESETQVLPSRARESRAVPCRGVDDGCSIPITLQALTVPSIKGTHLILGFTLIASSAIFSF